jgi:hypothetical protein
MFYFRRTLFPRIDTQKKFTSFGQNFSHPVAGRTVSVALSNRPALPVNNFTIGSRPA